MDIGFYITSIEGSNKDLLINAINEYVASHPYDNVVVFNDKYDALANNNFYTLHISHAKYFKGILFVFDINDASLVISFPAPKYKIFVANQPYWQNYKMNPYKTWMQIFNNPDMNIVVNNQSMFDIYETCWKPPLCIMSSINAKEIENVLQKI
jgi:hypothetical protein